MSGWTRIIMFSGALLAALPAQAGHSGDMFKDEGIDTSNRPEVPSDEYYGYRNQPDMYRKPAPFTTGNKDMFDSVPKPGDIGVEREFSAHPQPKPYGPLFNNPPASPPP